MSFIAGREVSGVREARKKGRNWAWMCTQFQLSLGLIDEWRRIWSRDGSTELSLWRQGAALYHACEGVAVEVRTGFGTFTSRGQFS